MTKSEPSTETIQETPTPEQLKKMIDRKLELDYMATSCAVAGQELPVEVEEEFLQLKADIEQALRATGKKP